MLRAATRHAERIGGAHNARLHQAVKEAQALGDTMASQPFQSQMFQQLLDYLTDAATAIGPDGRRLARAREQ